MRAVFSDCGLYRYELRRQWGSDDEQLAWMADANCLGCDPALFFPGRGEDQEAAKHVCSGCVVRAECLAYGMGERYGIFGGASERERRRLRRIGWQHGDPLPPVNMQHLGRPGRPRREAS